MAWRPAALQATDPATILTGSIDWVIVTASGEYKYGTCSDASWGGFGLKEISWAANWNVRTKTKKESMNLNIKNLLKIMEVIYCLVNAQLTKLII